jgi:hypothetical protein
MPTNQAELHTIMQGFYGIANFPNIVGAIDGTHVRIKSPSTDEYLYVNRKNYHSINVQGVCDRQIGNGWLIGDSGYPLRTWLLTPV